MATDYELIGYAALITVALAVTVDTAYAFRHRANVLGRYARCANEVMKAKGNNGISIQADNATGKVNVIYIGKGGEALLSGHYASSKIITDIETAGNISYGLLSATDPVRPDKKVQKATGDFEQCVAPPRFLGIDI